MKAHSPSLRVLLAVILLVSPLRAETEVRTWRDQKKDMAIDAELVKVEGEKITLKFSNGKSYTYPMTRFHEDDQFYAKEWAKEQAEEMKHAASKEAASDDIQRALVVAVKAVTEQGDSERTGDKELRGKKRVATTTYEVSLTNRGGSELKDVSIEYVVYTKSETSDSKDRKKDATTVREDKDKLKVEPLPPEKSVVATTKPVTATESNTEYKDDKKTHEKELNEKLLGIVVKVSVGGNIAKTIEEPSGLLRMVEKLNK